MIGTIMAIVVPISLFIVLFPKFVILIIAGRKYFDAALILQITIVANLVRPLGYHFGSTLDALGKPIVNFISSACLMTVSVVLTWIALDRFQGMGAAYALIAYNFISLVVMIAVLKKYIHLEIRNIPKYMFACYKDIFSLLWKLRKPKPAN
jgi:O-antigen/teichoic acid export membrane protein